MRSRDTCCSDPLWRAQRKHAQGPFLLQQPPPTKPPEDHGPSTAILAVLDQAVLTIGGQTDSVSSGVAVTRKG